ncbi:hypothetical protein AcW1_003856 [Taiwanofungus camphoratus]|nr:hypothetical protein AcW1_003856 [Antrodia cinnamomea]
MSEYETPPMPFKRPAPLPHDSSHSQSESSSLLIPSSKRPRVSNAAKALPTVKLYIIQAKLDAPALAELFVLAEGTVECICKDVKDANVVVTGISMRRRLERHIPWELAKQKAVVTPQWLRDSVEHGAPLPCEDYAALQDLRAETAAHCPDCNLAPCACSDVSSPSLSPGPTMGSRPPTPGGSQTIGQEPPPTSPTSASAIAPKARSRSKPTSKPASKPAPGPSTRPAAEVPVHLLPPSPPIPTNAAKLDFRSRYTCQRASPLECPNSGLVGELDIMRRARAMEGEERSALSYARAVAAIKAYPGRIRSLSQVETLPYIGTKISGMVEEFLETGKIGEAQTLLASPRFRTLSLFSSIYGIGPTTARRLYNLGLRSLQDLEIYYGVERRPMPSGGTVKIEEQEMVELEAQTPRWHGRQARGGGRARGFGEKGEGDEGLGDSWIRIALEIREDLSVKVPRDEVEEMNRVVMAELNALEPGCVSTIVGGYGFIEIGMIDIDGESRRAMTSTSYSPTPTRDVSKACASGSCAGCMNAEWLRTLCTCPDFTVIIHSALRIGTLSKKH